MLRQPSSDIVALARALAVHAGHGCFDMCPRPDSVTGRIITALMREPLILSGLAVYPELLA